MGGQASGVYVSLVGELEERGRTEQRSRARFRSPRRPRGPRLKPKITNRERVYRLGVRGLRALESGKESLGSGRAISLLLNEAGRRTSDFEKARERAKESRMTRSMASWPRRSTPSRT